MTFRCLSRELEKGSEVVRILRAWLSIIATYVRTHIAMTVFRDTDFRIDYVTISGRFLANQFTRLRYKNGLDPEKSIHHGYDFQITLSNRYLSASSLTLPYLISPYLEIFRSIVGDSQLSNKFSKNKSWTAKKNHLPRRVLVMGKKILLRGRRGGGRKWASLLARK